MAKHIYGFFEGAYSAYVLTGCVTDLRACKTAQGNPLSINVPEDKDLSKEISEKMPVPCEDRPKASDDPKVVALQSEVCLRRTVP